MSRTRDRRAPDPAELARQQGIALLRAHPLFTPLVLSARFAVDPGAKTCPGEGWAVVSSSGAVALNGTRRASPEEWAWVIGHCLLHLAFGHLDESHRRGFEQARGLTQTGAGYPAAWNAAACLAVRSFQAGLGLGSAPAALAGATPFDERAKGAGAEERLARELALCGVPDALRSVGTGGPSGDLVVGSGYGVTSTTLWRHAFSEGLQAALQRAVAVAAGTAPSMTASDEVSSRWREAIDWVVTNMPLLGGLAAGLRVLEDPELCRSGEISIAAIAPASGVLYLNPRYSGDAQERRFVVAHELLHAGLRHDTRANGRDPWFWNIAADYVINAWLVEMGVGVLPEGCLYDATLATLSAEEVYDRIVSDLRRYRKLATLRGPGRPDILGAPLPKTRADALGGVDLDEFYRRALSDGAHAHRRAGRGELPAGLSEAIAATAEPPPPWDVDLARWFEEHFTPLERRRSYARPSRRQSSTPDIPRPSWQVPDDVRAGRAFGVVLDTSGSMSHALLARALGAIASYATARDVTAVRVVFCDAVAYDAGWMAPADIGGTVTVRGRGGTRLQPGVELLEAASDFPPDGPILVVTDTECDHVRPCREHAYLVPAGRNLPFIPRGPVFRMR